MTFILLQIDFQPLHNLNFNKPVQKTTLIQWKTSEDSPELKKEREREGEREIGGEERERGRESISNQALHKKQDTKVKVSLV